MCNSSATSRQSGLQRLQQLHRVALGDFRAQEILCGHHPAHSHLALVHTGCFPLREFTIDLAMSFRTISRSSPFLTYDPGTMNTNVAASYEYDFGDDWRRTVALEGVDTIRKGERLAFSRWGRRCPPRRTAAVFTDTRSCWRS